MHIVLGYENWSVTCGFVYCIVLLSANADIESSSTSYIKAIRAEIPTPSDRETRIGMEEAVTW